MNGRHPLDELPGGVNRNGEHDFSYADARAIALHDDPDTLIMERKSYGWTFRIGWGLVTPPFSMWYDPDIQENT